MILSTTVLNGFKTGITEKVFGFWGHVHVMDSKINRSLELSPILDNASLKDSIAAIHGLVRTDSDGFGSEVATKGGVRDIHPFILLPAIINRKDDLEGIILKGVNHEYNWQTFQSYLKKGEFPDMSAGRASREILVSEQTARRLRVDVGDKLVIYFLEEKEAVKKAFNISGIYRTGLEEYDVKFAFIHLAVLQDVLQWRPDQVGGFEVFIDDIDDADAIADYIYSNVLPANLYAQTIQEKFGNLFEWIGLQDMNAFLLMILMTIVAIINMSTALLILILERSKMIGILKAIGAANWSIRKIFIWVALWIMGMALLIGNALGLGLSLFQQQTGLLKLDESSYYLSEVPIEFNLINILAVNIITILVTLLFMLVPSYLVTRVRIIKILRFD
jgi:lipoprotein-releasing system permease protein